MSAPLNTILQGDCVAGMNAQPAGSVDLVFADPPFNIGYEYDVYQDKLQTERYLAWSRDWISAVHRLLNPTGAFWLAIGDEYAAELKIESQKIGFHCRSWVIWYYTFGVNCSMKFTRSHAHLFHFVKDPGNFIFRADELENRIPSARQLVYNDNRANPKGRLPDDTWIIRPRDAADSLTPDEEEFDLRPNEEPQQPLPLPRNQLATPNQLPSGGEGRGEGPKPTSLTGPNSQFALTQDDLLPDNSNNTWILRPQDLPETAQAQSDTWYFPRVAGTFKERAGFHGCQMPEQLLGRIIRVCSEPGHIVADPFSGSGTTVAVAKKLRRQYLGFDLSPRYVELGLQRLENIREGDPLEGSPEPLMSAPRTESKQPGKRASQKPNAQKPGGRTPRDRAHTDPRDLEPAIRRAFESTYDGYSPDRVVVDPTLNSAFIAACRSENLPGLPRDWNLLLFRLRKAGKLADLPTAKRTSITWAHCDDYLFASEIAWQMLLDQQRARSIDEILCDPDLAAEFDAIASRFAPGFDSLSYRWAALKLRKQAKLARASAPLTPRRLGRPIDLAALAHTETPEAAGVYLVGVRRKSGIKSLYVGECVSLRNRLTRQFARTLSPLWKDQARTRKLQGDLCIQYATTSKDVGMLAYQSYYVTQHRPPLNLQDLRAEL